MWETSLIIGISYLCVTVAGFNLLQSPDEVVWGAEGKRFSLECKVDEAWQWCYWEITKVDGVSLQKIEQRLCDYPVSLQKEGDMTKDNINMSNYQKYFLTYFALYGKNVFGTFMQKFNFSDLTRTFMLE